MMVRLIIRENDRSVKFVYIYQENKGVSATRNRGIRIAKAEWIALLDSDDIWKKEKIERQYEVIMKSKDMIFLGSSYPGFGGFKKYLSGVIKVTPRQLCIRSIPSTPSVVFRKEDGIKLGLFNEERRYGEDIAFFQKFLLRDSYYLLCEDLIEVSIGKKYFAESGLSSNLIKMHQGRKQNAVELFHMGLISKQFLFLMQMFNEIKYFRRKLFSIIFTLRNRDAQRGVDMFSVIVSAYNCEKTIAKSLDSVKNQTRYDLIKEIIIINDGSTDQTGNVIEQYISSNPEMKCIYMRQENHGISHARNQGIMRANGKWIALLDCDDVWMPDKIERQYKHMFGNGLSNNEITFDIIVPIYNVENYLEKCLLSLKQQTYAHYRVLMIDDGSTDGSTKIARSFEDCEDNFFYFRKENGGLSDARNFGIDKSMADYILFIDSDDYIEKETLEILNRELMLKKVDVLEFNGWIVHEHREKEIFNKHYINSGKIMKGTDYFVTNLHNGCMYSAVVLKCVKRSLFGNGRLRFFKGIFHEDELWTPQLMLEADTIKYIDIKLYNYVQRNGSIMHLGKKEKNIRDAKIVFYKLEKLYNESNLNNKQKNVLRSYLCRKMIGLCQMDKTLVTDKDRKYIRRNARDRKSWIQSRLYGSFPQLLPPIIKIVKRITRYE